MSVPSLTIAPGSPPSHWEVRVPGSKSITNRALLLAGVADGSSRLQNPLIADDTEVMAAALRALGVSVELGDSDPAHPGERVWTVGGLAGPPTGTAALWCGKAGTVGRFLVPMLAAGDGHFSVDSDPQLRRRPLGPVLESLAAQGAKIEGEAFPLAIDARGLSGGVVTVDASISSQFLSGLLMAAPLARRATDAEVRTAGQPPLPGADARRDAGLRRCRHRRRTGAVGRAAAVPGDRARDRARCLDRVLLSGQRGRDRNDRTPTWPEPRAQLPGRPRDRPPSRADGMHRPRVGRGGRAHRPRETARRHRRHGQQLGRVHDARLRGPVRRRAHDDRGDRARPRQGIRQAGRDRREPAPARDRSARRATTTCGSSLASRTRHGCPPTTTTGSRCRSP